MVLVARFEVAIDEVGAPGGIAIPRRTTPIAAVDTGADHAATAGVSCRRQKKL